MLSTQQIYGTALLWLLRIGKASLSLFQVFPGSQWWPCEQTGTGRPSVLCCTPGPGPLVQSLSRSAGPSAHPVLEETKSHHRHAWIYLGVIPRGEQDQRCWLAQLLRAAGNSWQQKSWSSFTDRTEDPEHKQRVWNMIGWFVLGSNILISWQWCQVYQGWEGAGGSNPEETGNTAQTEAMVPQGWRENVTPAELWSDELGVVSKTTLFQISALLTFRGSSSPLFTSISSSIKWQ